MKILLINHFPLIGSGSGIYVMNIAKSLEKKGHKVCVIMPENTTKIINIENVKIHPVFFKKEEIIKGQLDFNFPCMDAHPRSDFLFQNMTRLQIEQYEIAFRNAIEEELEEFQPDIIHSQHIWIVSGLLKHYKIPYIITSHGAEFITYKKTNMFNEYGNKAVEGCKKIIAISDDNIEEIISKFPNAENKIEFIKNGYNSQDFYREELNRMEILKKFSIYKRFDNIVLFVGRISKLKGLDILLKATNKYETQKTLTLIVGDGDYRRDLEKLKERLKLHNIVFLGSKGHEDLRLLYNISDVLVLPSRKEALPLVAIEALACGTPAVVSNVSGMDKIITKEVVLLFEVDNEEMLAEKIKLILNKKIIFKKEKIANYAKRNYSQETLMNKLIELYEEIRRK